MLRNRKSMSTNLSKGIIYYTDNQLDPEIAGKVQNQLNTIGLPIVSCSLAPMPNFGKNIHLPLERGYPAMFKQILAALEASDVDIIFFCEHDVLYHPSHFDFVPPAKDKFYYNQNCWRVRMPDGFAVRWDTNINSCLCAYRDILMKYYQNKVDLVEKTGKISSGFGVEPGGRDNSLSGTWRSLSPNVDIRHGHNLTRDVWNIDDLRKSYAAKNFEIGGCPEWAKTILEI